MANVIAGLLMVIGTFFLAAGSIGLIRFPDVLCRMHATTKTTTLGACSILLAAAVKYGHSPIGLKSLLAVAFLLLTAPVGAHMIARAAYRGRAPLATHRMVADDLQPVVEEAAYVSEQEYDRPSR
ncbi:MAG: monovalent cation/H(+) antiporter subunit G [Candidatus Methylomirabilales bacterium]